MRFYCSDDTVDLEQYPYHVEMSISATHLFWQIQKAAATTLMYSLRIQNVSQMWKLTKNTVYFMYLKVRI